jgi:hypothetical protein
MERRQAIAWAGSAALTACVTALALGSLIGGFGFDVSQPTQAPHAIGPRLTPKSPTEPPGLPKETPGPEERPAPDPAQQAAPNAPAPAPEGTAAPPPAAPRDTENYPRVSVGDQKVPANVPISWLKATTHSPVVPMPASDVDKPNNPPRVDKAARPIVDNNRIAGSAGGDRTAGSAGGASRRDVPMTDVPKRATKPSWARDILAGVRGFHDGTARSSGLRNDVSISGRSTDTRAQAGTTNHRVGGRNDGAR